MRHAQRRSNVDQANPLRDVPNPFKGLGDSALLDMGPYISHKTLGFHSPKGKGSQHYIINHANGKPYLERWKLLPDNRWFNVYLHKWLDSDDYTYGLHNHPYHAVAITLRGRLQEWRRSKNPPVHLSRNWSRIRFYARDKTFHGIDRLSANAWSLFICFGAKRDRDWGFRQLTNLQRDYIRAD